MLRIKKLPKTSVFEAIAEWKSPYQKTKPAIPLLWRYALRLHKMWAWLRVACEGFQPLQPAHLVCKKEPSLTRKWWWETVVLIRAQVKKCRFCPDQLQVPRPLEKGLLPAGVLLMLSQKLVLYPFVKTIWLADYWSTDYSLQKFWLERECVSGKWFAKWLKISRSGYLWAILDPDWTFCWASKKLWVSPSGS